MPKTVSLRVICVHPPASQNEEGRLIFGLQDKNRDIVAGTQTTDARLQFSFELSAKQTMDGKPNFMGKWAHGTAQKRFVYLTQYGNRDGEWTIIKRIKVQLESITWQQVEAVMNIPGSFLVVEVDGRGAATVPLLGDGWQVQQAPQ